METVSGAYCARSGKFDLDPTGFTEDNVLVSTKHIYICGNITNTRNRREMIDAISHELAHFVSAPGFSVVDTLDGHSSRDEHRFRDGVYNRISNAENYAWFTWRSFECKFTF